MPSSAGRLLRSLGLRATHWCAGDAVGLGAGRIRGLGRPLAFVMPSSGGRALRALALRATHWCAGDAVGLGAGRIRGLGRPVAGRQLLVLGGSFR
jgi:hypothetical protein